jgi:hypothetical protein
MRFDYYDDGDCSIRSNCDTVAHTYQVSAVSEQYHLSIPAGLNSGRTDLSKLGQEGSQSRAAYLRTLDFESNYKENDVLQNFTY